MVGSALLDASMEDGTVGGPRDFRGLPGVTDPLISMEDGTVGGPRDFRGLPGVTDPLIRWLPAVTDRSLIYGHLSHA